MVEKFELGVGIDVSDLRNERPLKLWRLKQRSVGQRLEAHVCWPGEACVGHGWRLRVSVFQSSRGAKALDSEAYNLTWVE